MLQDHRPGTFSKNIYNLLQYRVRFPSEAIMANIVFQEHLLKETYTLLRYRVRFSPEAIMANIVSQEHLLKETYSLL